MKIQYKGIVNERMDAPFTGALIIAKGCSKNCKGCFNQHLKSYKTLTHTSSYILNTVQENMFNKGIILGGLEWTDQLPQLKHLIKEAKKRNLEVMLYTGLSLEQVIKNGLNIEGIYVKYGSYNENYLDNNYFSNGVKLSSTNQKIKKF